MANVANNMPRHPAGDRGGNETTASSIRTGSAYYRRGGESKNWYTTGSGASRLNRSGSKHTSGNDSGVGKDMRTLTTGSNIKRRGR